MDRIDVAWANRESRWPTTKVLLNVGRRKEGILAMLDPESPIDTTIIRQAFDIADDIRGFGVASITRLLCLKRPDRFLAVNGGNKDLMKERMGYSPKDADSYINMLAAIDEAPWFKAKRPKDPRERKVWNARVALLDRLLYEP